MSKPGSPLGSTGRTGFVTRHKLWDDARATAAERALNEIAERDIKLVRLSFADQHGILRGKTLVADEVAGAFKNGVAMVTTLLTKDTAHRTITAWHTPGGGLDMEEMTGGGDFLMVPDPSTFRVLPWAESTGWMLCDIYFTNGKPVPFSTRQILKDSLARLGDAGFAYVSGVEVEFHVYKLDDPKLRPEDAGQPATPPSVSLLAHGFQYLTEQRMDELDQVFQLIRKGVVDLGLPLRSLEVEFGPSQFEVTLQPGQGIETADAMILFRSAVKQICRRHGYHATFMCRPGLPNAFSSGWHLHQSLRDAKSGANAFVPDQDGELLSPLGRHFVAGLLTHARAGAIFAAPTINGYKRYRAFSLAPDRAAWGRDNRGAMIRALGGPGDAGTRVENRAGEPAANPYLYIASQVIAGLDGMARKAEPPAPSDSPYAAAAPLLPKSLMEAVGALREDQFFRAQMGSGFVDYLLAIKDAEIARFLSEVTDWEQREYFEMF
jgi:glutamine synthetase